MFPLQTHRLTEEQRAQILGILSVGCDRQTAANYAGCSLADIRRAMQRDAKFAADLCRAEASAELQHMRVMQKAAEDVKNWRASAWWLERRAPDRFGPRAPGVVTARQLKAFVEILADVIHDNIQDNALRQRILTRLHSIAASVNQMLRDLQSTLADTEATIEIDALAGVVEQPHKSLNDFDDSAGFMA